jgi:hypothetical protein
MTEVYEHCLRCGKALSNPKNRERGYGPVCWRKHTVDELKQRVAVGAVANVVVGLVMKAGMVGEAIASTNLDRDQTHTEDDEKTLKMIERVSREKQIHMMCYPDGNILYEGKDGFDCPKGGLHEIRTKCSENFVGRYCVKCGGSVGIDTITGLNKIG